MRHNCPIRSRNGVKSQNGACLLGNRGRNRSRSKTRILIRNCGCSHCAAWSPVGSTAEVVIDSHGIPVIRQFILRRLLSRLGCQLTHPCSLESALVMGLFTFLKALLSARTWAPIRVLMADDMLILARLVSNPHLLSGHDLPRWKVKITHSS